MECFGFEDIMIFFFFWTQLELKTLNVTDLAYEMLIFA